MSIRKTGIALWCGSSFLLRTPIKGGKGLYFFFIANANKRRKGVVLLFVANANKRRKGVVLLFVANANKRRKGVVLLFVATAMFYIACFNIFLRSKPYLKRRWIDRVR